MITMKVKAAFSTALYLSALAASLAAFASRIQAQEPAHGAIAGSDEDIGWLAIAPAAVKSSSGETMIFAPVVGVVGEVGQSQRHGVSRRKPLILSDRQRNPGATCRGGNSGRHAQARTQRRVPLSQGCYATRAEDAVADAEQAISEAQSLLDQVAIARRAGRSSNADVDTARLAMTRAQDRLKQQKAELRRIEADSPLPTQARRPAQYRAP